ncbi:hypothetical protein [Streptomyces showdoensis]|uniref:hypothetical protein n=1 Tax=Streptomyces showdoensis TaxID=68268 RepID=UPI0031ED5A98
MASLARAQGDTATPAARFEPPRPRALRTYFNTTWSGTGSGADMVRAATPPTAALTGWGQGEQLVSCR